VKIICPRCGEVADLIFGSVSWHRSAEKRTFTRIPGDSTKHFFDVRLVCPYSGACAKLGEKIKIVRKRIK
jgi:hypothetical protein